MLGAKFQECMVGSGRVFHISKCETLNKVISAETGIPDKCPPGPLPAMKELAIELWVANKTPMNVCHDERGVSN